MKPKCSSGSTARLCLQTGIKLTQRQWSGHSPFCEYLKLSQTAAPIYLPKWMDNIRRAAFTPGTFVIFCLLMLQKCCQKYLCWCFRTSASDSRWNQNDWKTLKWKSEIFFNEMEDSWVGVGRLFYLFIYLFIDLNQDISCLRSQPTSLS